MPRREPRWARKRAAAATASKRPEPRFGVTDYVPSPPRSGSGGGPGASGAGGGTAAGGAAAGGAAASGGAAAGGTATAAATSGRGASSPGDDGAQGRRRRRWRLPLAMLITGLVLGAGGVGVLVANGTLGTTTVAPTPEPTRSAVTVTVPESCAEAGRLSEQVAGITQEIVVATGELDAARLQVLVDQLQGLDPQVRAATAACRQDSPTLSATTG